MSHAVGRSVFSGRYLPTLCRCAAVFLHLMFLIPAVPAAEIAIFLRPEAEVRGPDIRLGEVAEIACVETELQRRLEGLVIGKAPLPGRSRNISADYVRLRLRQLDIEAERTVLGGAERIEVSLPGVVLVHDEDHARICVLHKPIGHGLDLGKLLLVHHHLGVCHVLSRAPSPSSVL